MVYSFWGEALQFVSKLILHALPFCELLLLHYFKSMKRYVVRCKSNVVVADCAAASVAHEA